VLPNCFRLGALCLLVALPASAQRCARPPEFAGAGIAAGSDHARLEFLARVASAEATNLGTWKLVWGAAFGALVLGQLAFRPLFPAETGTDYYWGAAYSALGFTSTLLPPPEVFTRGAPFAAAAASASDENRCALIAEGERLFREGADTEAFGAHWYIHALNVAVNVSLGLIIGLGYHRWGTAALDMGLGIALSETMLFTKPTGLVSAWREYTSGTPLVSRIQLRLSPTAEGGLLLGVGGSF
jgi:hypothetical protein